MVKFYRILFLILILICACFFSGCNVDLLGVFGSNDLNVRLREKNNLKFLNDRSWTTLPSLGNEYSFIVLVDTHIEDGKAWGLEKLADVISANNEIKFAVIVGDITQYGAARDIRKFIEIADSLGVPCYPVIGNHDIYFDNWSVWKNLIGSTRYRIDGDNTTLIVIDSANAFFGRDQIDWLQRELKSAGPRVFVFSHTNLFVENPLEVHQFTDTKERARIASILRNRCDAMFMGHLHKRNVRDVGNVKYISIEDYRKERVYCLVSVNAGGVSYKFEKL